ncbi:hypothetical protein PPROV_000650400 [Pycnococcus provasolii]|uniref:Uncharacterized protein n=2 Tax=Pycnococcus provasolii TaxID=41880 RepID=A0A830HLL0_9CHLO|nr:hypothetical protein PPROV_000650400 [Pycnococcus provasolii]
MLKVPQSGFSKTADAQRYYEAHPMERLYEQKRQETRFFSSGGDDLKNLHERCSAGIGALVLRLEKEYSKYLSTTWKTQALKRVISAFDEKEFQLNLLGLEDQNEDNIRTAAVAEVERRLGCTMDDGPWIDELYSNFFDTFLEEKVVEKLDSVEGLGITMEVEPYELKGFLADMQTQILAIVDDALASYKSYWMDSLEEALTAETKVVVTNAGTSTINIVTSFWSRTLELFARPIARRKVYTEVKKAPPFHLAVYPTFVEGILAKQRQLFEDAHAAISEKIYGVIEAIDKGMPYLEVHYQGGGCFEVSAFHRILLSKVVEIFAIHTPTPTAIRAQHDGVPIGVENNDVAAERRELQNDLVKVKQAQDGMCAAFGVTEEEIAALRAELDIGD